MSQSVEIPNPTQTPQPALEANCDTVVDVEESAIHGQDFTPSPTYDDQDCLDNHDEDLEDSQESDIIYSYDVPRPALTVEEAAGILGKSVRAIERSIAGKWGNRLPEGWKARKMKLDGEVEWRILPPAGFRIRRSTSNITRPKIETEEQESMTSSTQQKPQDSTKSTLDFGFTLEKLFSAGKKAGNELVKVAENAMENGYEQHPTIVIDRASDVEKLLRELADTQKELATERMMHIEDLRQMHEMATSMRLLEMRGTQTQILKEELEGARNLLKAHKERYEAYVTLPWWKKLFVSTP
ncbi:MAG: hypothetical protein IPG59_10210 [Candidatus Melainabacteria bacterium]|nr:MAG: hypothetical protein IPG59_10210 [Candidatus Melainabacteria bacterium]